MVEHPARGLELPDDLSEGILALFRRADPDLAGQMNLGLVILNAIEKAVVHDLNTC